METALRMKEKGSRLWLPLLSAHDFLGY